MITNKVTKFAETEVRDLIVGAWNPAVDIGAKLLCNAGSICEGVTDFLVNLSEATRALGKSLKDWSIRFLEMKGEEKK